MAVSTERITSLRKHYCIYTRKYTSLINIYQEVFLSKLYHEESFFSIAYWFLVIVYLRNDESRDHPFSLFFEIQLAIHNSYCYTERKTDVPP